MFNTKLIVDFDGKTYMEINREEFSRYYQKQLSMF